MNDDEVVVGVCMCVYVSKSNLPVISSGSQGSLKIACTMLIISVAFSILQRIIECGCTLIRWFHFSL